MCQSLLQRRLGSPDLPPRLVEWLAPNPPPLGVWIQDLDVKGPAACLTVWSPDAPRVRLRQAVRGAGSLSHTPEEDPSKHSAAVDGSMSVGVGPQDRSAWQRVLTGPKSLPNQRFLRF